MPSPDADFGRSLSPLSLEGLANPIACSEPGHSLAEHNAGKAAISAAVEGLLVGFLCIAAGAAENPVCPASRHHNVYATMPLAPPRTLAAVAAGWSLGAYLRVAAMFGIGLAMGTGWRDYVRFRTETSHFARERARERWELDNFPAGSLICAAPCQLPLHSPRHNCTGQAIGTRMLFPSLLRMCLQVSRAR